METYDLYKDIAERTDGDIYMGVVGPVRTGKSTFIKRFMDLMVLPNIENSYRKERTIDELPQSGSGKTIMTTQPKFVPNEAVEISLSDSAHMKMRMVDCVGYLVPGAMGHEEDDAPRMVRTPWFDHDIPFEEAAELGTRKVITDHSTIGIVVTCDGSISEIPRSNYIEAEERVVGELKELNKPFVVVLNSTDPRNPDIETLREGLEEKYDVPVLAVNVMEMEQGDVDDILSKVLFEFPLRQVHLEIPEWMQALKEDHWLIEEVMEALRDAAANMTKMRDYATFSSAFENIDSLTEPKVDSLELGEGRIEFAMDAQPGLFYKVLEEECGVPIQNDYQLMSMMKELTHAKREYDRVKDALDSVRETGYGLVAPTMDELVLDEPELVKQGNRFGVRLKASAPSLHLIRVDIETEVSPIVGTEKQSEELVKYLLSEFENDPAKIWSTDMFGKSLHELVKEGLSGKLMRMPDDAQQKIQETLSRIINDGSGGLICILL